MTIPFIYEYGLFDITLNIWWSELTFYSRPESWFLCYVDLSLLPGHEFPKHICVQLEQLTMNDLLYLEILKQLVSAPQCVFLVVCRFWVFFFCRTPLKTQPAHLHLQCNLLRKFEPQKHRKIVFCSLVVQRLMFTLWRSKKTTTPYPQQTFRRWVQEGLVLRHLEKKQGTL